MASLADDSYSSVAAKFSHMEQHAVVRFWATVCNAIRPLFVLSVCLSLCAVLSCLWRWYTVTKRLDGSR